MQATAITFSCPGCQAPLSFPVEAVGQSGPCYQCGTSITVQAPPSPALAHVQNPGGLWEEVSENEQQNKTLARLDKELAKAGGIELLATRVLRLDVVVTDEDIHAQRKAAKKLGGAPIRADTVQCIRLVAGPLHFFLFIPYFGGEAMAHEWASMVNGTLPSCVYYDRDGPKPYDIGQWMGSEGGAQDPTAMACKRDKAIYKGVEWNHYMFTGDMLLKWGLQAVPEGERTVHLMHSAPSGVVKKRFDPKWYLDRRAAFEAFVSRQAPTAARATPSYRHSPISMLFMDKVLGT